MDVEFFLSSHRKKTWSEISSLLQLNHISSQRKKRCSCFQRSLWKNEPGSVYFFLWLHACVLSCFSHIQLFVILWTVARQAPLSLGFSRRGLPWPPPGDLPNPGIKPRTPVTLALQANFLPLSHKGSPRN